MTTLKPGRSKVIFGYNVKTLLKAGYSQRQAEKIAESHADKTAPSNPVIPIPQEPDEILPTGNGQ